MKSLVLGLIMVANFPALSAVDTSQITQFFDSISQNYSSDFAKVDSFSTMICSKLWDQPKQPYCFYAQSWRHTCAIYWNNLEVAEDALQKMEAILKPLGDSAYIHPNYFKLTKCSFLSRIGRFDEMQEILYSISDTMVADSTMAQYIRAKYLHLARVAELKGQWMANTRYIQKSIDYELQRANQYGIRPMIAPNQGRLGRSYVRLERYSEAIPLLKTAINYYEKSLLHRPTNIPYLIPLIRDLALAYSGTAHHHKADSTFDACLTLHENDAANIARTYLAMSQSYVQRSDLETALQYSKLSLKKTTPSEFSLRAKIHLHIGDIQSAMGMQQDALLSYQQASDATSTLNGEPLFPQNIHTPDGFLADVKSIEILARVNEKEALSKWHRAMGLVSQLEKSATIIDDQISILANTYKLYEIYLDILHEQDLKKADTIFHIFAMSRSHILRRELLQGQSLRLNSQQGQKVETLRNKISLLKKSLLSESNSSTLLTQKNRLFDYQDQLDQILKETPPSHAHLSLSVLQDQISEHTAILTFLWGDTSLYIANITKSNVTLHQITDIKDLSELIWHILEKTHTKQDIYSHLIRVQDKLDAALTFPDDADRIIVLPDGLFTHFPFGMLPAFREKSVFYALTFDQIAEAGRAQINHVNLMAPFADTPVDHRSMPDRYTLLKYSAEEVKGISHETGGTAVLDDQCTNDHYRRLIHQSDILHLATHAKIDLDEPEYSHILMSDDPIYAFEIQSDPTAAKMITLSACDTHVGRQIKGEGNLSLARSYIQAGAKSVIASLWAVNDESTARIMTQFYKHLRRGLSKDRALLAAKKDYLDWADPDYQHPYYWAGFIAIGDMSPLYNSSNIWLLWLLGISIVMVVWFAYWAKNKRFNVHRQQS